MITFAIVCIALGLFFSILSKAVREAHPNEDTQPKEKP